MSIVPAKECVSTMIRFSPVLHRRIKELAERNGRSMNTEINLLLENALSTDQDVGVANDLMILMQATKRIESMLEKCMAAEPSPQGIVTEVPDDRHPTGHPMPLKTKSFPSFSEWQQAARVAGEEQE